MQDVLLILDKINNQSVLIIEPLKTSSIMESIIYSELPPAAELQRLLANAPVCLIETNVETVKWLDRIKHLVNQIDKRQIK